MGEERKIKQTKRGVTVTTHLPGRVLREPGPDKAVVRQRQPPARCPYCKEEGREGRSERVTWSNGVGYYKCRECCDPETGRPTRFKVLTRE